jgi:hypothetical protein
MSKKVIKLTESQLKNIVERVIDEQSINPIYSPMSLASFLGPNSDEESKKRLTNIANIYSSVKNGVIVNPKSQFNNTSWMDFVTKYQVTDKEQLAAKGLISQRKTASDTQNKRMINIANAFHSVDPSTLKIKSNNPKLNGMSWSDYMATYKVTSEEARKALAYSNSLPKTAPVSGATSGSTVTNKTAPRKSDPKVLALQKSLGLTGKDLDGIMGPKTRAAMAAKKGGSTQMKYDSNGKPVTPGTRGGQTAFGDTSKGNYEQYAWDNQSGSWILAQDWRKKNGTIPMDRPSLDKLKMNTTPLNIKAPTLQAPQSNVSDQRKQEIVSKIEKQAGTGKLMYKGDDLNRDEQQFLNAYIQASGGGEMDKSKDKSYGQKIVYKNN